MTTHDHGGAGPPADPRRAAPVICSNVPGSFAWSVLQKRHPALVEQVRDAFPFGPAQLRALDLLLSEVVDGPITPLEDSAADHRVWAGWGRDYFGSSWFDVPFLWAESFFYRKLLAATGYFEPGPWQGVDIFAPFKQAELHSRAVDDELHALEGLRTQPAAARGEVLLQSSLWGNRADLGFTVTATEPVQQALDANLVADDGLLLWSLLRAGKPGTVAIVADNAGRELIPDLVLADHLLQHRLASGIVLYVKPCPYYVSDATTADVIDSLRRLNHAPGAAGETGRRLWEAAGDGRLQVRTHPFFCAPLPYRHMDADLRDEFTRPTLTLMKGDLNYRRLVGDQAWDPTTPYTDLTGYFPSPVAALRTLKSDVVTGLTPQKVAELDASGMAWRTSGTHALIQVRV